MNTFDRLFATAGPLIAAGRHNVEIPLVENGNRWPVSAAFTVDPADPVAHRLDALTREAASIAGPGHFQTGQLGSAHLTIRALERYREQVTPADPVVQRYTTALRSAASQVAPVRFTLTGLILTRGTVMVCAQPLDDHADHLQKLYAEALGPDAWLEADSPRDIWYINLLHFAAPIPSPTALLTWATTHRNHPIGDLTITTADLVRFHHEEGVRPHRRPETLVSVQLGQPTVPRPRPA
ncbi:hypothetical protein [Kribbella lupini]|uniref:2'-5' RNA ligase superfamily protein n=1 Tax=Kribbella lupini TaxID=291602 RepID=A0ABP4N791_9ACTN